MSKRFRKIKNDFRGRGTKLSNRGVRKYLHIKERVIKILKRHKKAGG